MGLFKPKKTPEEERLIFLLAERKRLDRELIEAGNAREAAHKRAKALTKEYEDVVNELKKEYGVKS